MKKWDLIISYALQFRFVLVLSQSFIDWKRSFQI